MLYELQGDRQRSKLRADVESRVSVLINGVAKLLKFEVCYGSATRSIAPTDKVVRQNRPTTTHRDRADARSVLLEGRALTTNSHGVNTKDKTRIRAHSHTILASSRFAATMRVVSPCGRVTSTHRKPLLRPWLSETFYSLTTGSGRGTYVHGQIDVSALPTTCGDAKSTRLLHLSHAQRLHRENLWRGQYFRRG